MRHLILLPLLLVCVVPALAQDGVMFGSPGLPSSRMDAQGRLVEDWGTVQIKLTGEGIPVTGEMKVESLKLDGVVPAARARLQRGAVAMTMTAFRAPIYPSGTDVLTVRLEETTGRETAVTLSLDLPEGAQSGSRTVTMGGRQVLTLPVRITNEGAMREWGFADEATPLPGWAAPEGPCDPAFRNIRAGMNGVPIFYRIGVEPKSAANVVLGLCESHWAQAGQRPLVCRVEGAPAQSVDPVARWGRHKPGALLFKGQDVNGDGKLDVTVVTPASVPDQNPILNVLWVFPPSAPPDLEQVVAGRLNGMALRYVDVGGPGDQSLYPPGKAEWTITLPPKGVQEFTFYVASPGGAAPLPDKSAWTTETLRRVARDVWRDWPGK